MRELLSTLFSDQPDVEIVGAVSADEHIADHVEKMRPDFVIVDFEDGAKVSDQLLRVFQHLKILAIPSNKNNSRLYWTDGEIHWRKLATSVVGILHALRDRHESRHHRAAMGLPKAS
jgi:chemotaxis response regulator CheB